MLETLLTNENQGISGRELDNKTKNLQPSLWCTAIQQGQGGHPQGPPNPVIS
jgi:hypothetical protein